MIRSVTKILITILILLFGLNSFAQYHLYFYIPECPNPTSIAPVLQADLSVYPKPASNYVFVSFSETISNDAQFDLSIYSINGLKVFSQSYKSDVNSANIIKINTETFKAGVYYLQYKNKYFTRTDKIIITN
ncbi:MAG: T9SS type A sorting domain-containing protein [Bacteroidales bacterium]|jgi:hypothetical protein|nr:T9SS type A sorting domain-containing protein [Bacteroidales bacterium]MDD4216870.1 T9SS type A sorting domain-containing protein [Bacteroidales bacterium]MDY0141916.1 T9SS type A sorting domain-containing protein [Bacteroidales bacterium]